MSLPTGTVTFLFTDIEGSTKLWERFPEQMRAVLARHDELAAEVVRRRQGTLVKSRGEGDSLFIVFADPAAALAAALAFQQAIAAEPWPEDITLRVRMALHSGEAQMRESDYYGPTVNRAARLRAIAYGAQVVLSQSVYSAVCGALPPEAQLRDMGSHRLKDLQQPEHVWQLLHPSLPAEFPPLKSLNVLLHNLPQQITSFVGREKEVAEVQRLLTERRLVTLTGSGGCGKTRLALQVAADMLDENEDGVWLIELAALPDPSLLVSAVASVLNIREEPGRDLLQTLIEQVKSKRLLLILDNCEHLLDACVHFVNALLLSCPSVRFLASSRENLGIPGEYAYRIPSLAMPDPKRLPPVETLLQYEAIRLFTDRAQAVNPAFAITATNAPFLAEICHRLDGIPLAIELAATRVRALPPEQIAARLNDRFRILTGGNRTALPRQQTLRAMIDWSYDLLSESEKTLLCRLSVFSGGWTLEAAEQVCSEADGTGDEEVPAIENQKSKIENWEILDLLTALVDKSLVVYVDQEGLSRYRLLETIRQYARERLAQTGENAALLTYHSRYFLGLAQGADALLRGPQAPQALAQMEMELDNFRTALEWCLADLSSEENLATGRQLVEALWWFLDKRGHFSEGRGWLEKALLSAPAQTEERAALLTGASNLALHQGDYPAARAYAEESLAIRQALGSPEKIAVAFTNLGNAAGRMGDEAEANRCHLESLKISRQLQDKMNIARSSNNLGIVAYRRGDYQEALTFWLESLEALRELEDRHSIAVILLNLGELACSAGEYAEARTSFAECLLLTQQLGDRYTFVSALEFCAEIFRRQGQVKAAAQLWGASEQIREALGSPLRPEDHPTYTRDIAEIESALGKEAFASAWQAGRSLTMEQAILIVQQELSHA